MPTSILLLVGVQPYRRLRTDNDQRELAMFIAMCAATLLVLPPGEKANRLDLETVHRAHTRCTQLFPKSPCAKKVVRKDKLSYRVYCGKPK
jgi:hypothetical protein